MGCENSFHAVSGLDFLGLRKTRRGRVEIVYDDGAARRMVWRVAADQAPVCETSVTDALRVAVDAPYILPRLYHELKKRALEIERV
jgi:hypothetical protein